MPTGGAQEGSGNSLPRWLGSGGTELAVLGGQGVRGQGGVALASTFPSGPDRKVDGTL